MFELLIVLVLLSVVLAFVAGILWYKVWLKTKQDKVTEQLQRANSAEQEQKRLDYLNESINVIAAAVLDEQCPLTEGCIRIAVLMDNLSLDCEAKHHYSVLFEIYNATRHIPTHSQWKSLDRAEQRRYQQEMFALEKQHHTEVMELMESIKQNPFGKGVGATLH